MNWYQTILISLGVYILLTYFLTKIYDSIKKSEEERAIVRAVSFYLEKYSMLFEELITDIHDIENPDSEIYEYPGVVAIKFNRFLYLSYKLEEKGEEIFLTTSLAEHFYLMTGISKDLHTNKNYKNNEEFVKKLNDYESYTYSKKETQHFIQEINKQINEIKEKHKIVFR